MPTRANRYYNDPALGAAFSNLASIFAPPDPQEAASWAVAEKTRAENKRLSDLYAAAQGGAPMEQLSRLGVGAGIWAPTQSWDAQVMGDQTQRYGYDQSLKGSMYSADQSAAASRYGHDRSYASSTENNVRDNSRALQTNLLDNKTDAITSLFGKVGRDETRPVVPDEFMQELGLPGIDTAVHGVRSPMSETEMVGTILGDAYFDDPEMLREIITRNQASDVNLETIMGPEGDPTFVTRDQAIGQTPVPNTGSQAAKQFKTYTSPNGSGIAVLDPNTGMGTDLETGATLPPNSIIGDVLDTRENMTTGTSSAIQKQALAIASGKETIGRLRAILQESPSSQGLVGTLRGTAQNIIQTGNELGQYFGGTMAEVNDAVNDGLIDAGIASEMFDPNIPAIEMLTNVLAWQYAKSFAGDRVSNEQLRIARQAIGGAGLFANQANSLTRLNELEGMFDRESQRISTMLPPQLQQSIDAAGAGAPPVASGTIPNVAEPAQPATPRARNPQTGEEIMWNGEAWVPAQ